MLSPCRLCLSASIASSCSSCRPSRRASWRSSSDNWLLSMLGILGRFHPNITIPPMLSKAIAVANDTPEMSAATPNGFRFQPSPQDKTPTEYPINERKNRKQKALPVNLMLSLIALPMVPAMARNRQPISFHSNLFFDRIVATCQGYHISGHSSKVVEQNTGCFNSPSPLRERVRVKPLGAGTALADAVFHGYKLENTAPTIWRRNPATTIHTPAHAF